MYIDPLRLPSRLAPLNRPPLSGPAPSGARSTFDEVAEVLEGVRVLLVEDDAVNAMVEKYMLEAAGAQVQLVESAEQALRVLDRPWATFDVLVLDLQLPQMSGLDVAKAVRQHPQDTVRAVPMLALSGNLLNGEPEACMEAGIDLFLAKPASLIDAVQSLLRPHRLN